jgi:hypothetical protein
MKFMPTYRPTTIIQEFDHSQALTVKPSLLRNGKNSLYVVWISHDEQGGEIILSPECLNEFCDAVIEHAMECDRRNHHHQAPKHSLGFVYEGDGAWEAVSCIGTDDNGFTWRIHVDEDGMFSVETSDSELIPQKPPKFSTLKQMVAWCNHVEAANTEWCGENLEK